MGVSGRVRTAMPRLAARDSVEDHVDRQRVERPLVELRHGAAHLPGPGLGWRVGARARSRVGAGAGKRATLRHRFRVRVRVRARARAKG